MSNEVRTTGQDADRLDSWKEIARYLGKSVRTAIRWSQDEGMPVYRHAGSTHGPVYAYRSEIDAWIHSNRSASPQASQKPLFLRIGALAILVLITAVAVLWLNSDAQRPKPATEEPIWVLITDFENLSGDKRLDGTLETALRRELANSRHVLAVAPERVWDTLALMNRKPGVTVDAELGREICLRYGGNCAVLTGRVDKFDSRYLLSLELVDPTGGRTVAGVEAEAEGDSGILPAIHRLGNWLREQLGEELAQIHPVAVELEAATTPSLRALELYSKGMQDMYALRFAEAEALFRQAAEEDPGFASAHLFVFWALNNQEPWQRSEEEMRSYLERAMELADTASEQERYFIEGSYYQYLEKNYEEACASYRLLAGLFPSHYWAAFNAAHVCGEVLGRRDEYVRYLVQAAEQRLEAKVLAAVALTLIAKDFDRARPYVEELEVLGKIDNGIPPGWKAWAVAFNEFFAAEEYLDKGLLPDVVREIERVERVLEGTTSPPLREELTWRLVKFYLALGQYRKALDLGHKASTWSILPAWLAYLTGDQSAFREQTKTFLAQYQAAMPDPAKRAAVYLSRNMTWWMEGFPVFVLAPMYGPESAVALASSAVLDESAGEFSTEFLHWPALEAKLQLARGIQMLNEGQPEGAIAPLESGIGWFGEYGGWEKYSYLFVGAEVLAVVMAGQGHPEAAYRVLKGVAMQRNMVNSYSAPLHQKIQARLALLARELGRIDEAEAIEAELTRALEFADPNHPILVQIREQQDAQMEPE